MLFCRSGAPRIYSHPSMSFFCFLYSFYISYDFLSFTIPSFSSLSVVHYDPTLLDFKIPPTSLFRSNSSSQTFSSLTRVTHGPFPAGIRPRTDLIGPLSFLRSPRRRLPLFILGSTSLLSPEQRTPDAPELEKEPHSTLQDFLPQFCTHDTRLSIKCPIETKTKLLSGPLTPPLLPSRPTLTLNYHRTFPHHRHFRHCSTV